MYTCIYYLFLLRASGQNVVACIPFTFASIIKVLKFEVLLSSYCKQIMLPKACPIMLPATEQTMLPTGRPCYRITPTQAARCRPYYCLLIDLQPPGHGRAFASLPYSANKGKGSGKGKGTVKGKRSGAATEHTAPAKAPPATAPAEPPAPAEATGPPGACEACCRPGLLQADQHGYYLCETCVGLDAAVALHLMISRHVTPRFATHIRNMVQTLVWMLENANLGLQDDAT